jgi:hypothetical protein
MALWNPLRKRSKNVLPGGLQSGRGFVIPNEQEQARETTDFELVTWLVIKNREDE